MVLCSMVALAFIMPIIATILFAISISMPNWEFLSFDYRQLLENHSNVTMKTNSFDIELIIDHNNVTHGAIVNQVWPLNGSNCIYDYLSGIWYFCDLFSSGLRASSGCANWDLLKQSNACFNYISDYSDLNPDIINLLPNIKGGAFLIKMQNNIISCIIVVLLSVLTAFGIGLLSVVKRMVPGVMVTGVLYFTAGLFVFFTNCIQHEKVKKLLSSDKTCYPLFTIPETICSPQYIRVETGWPLLLSWIVSLLFFVTAGIWFCVTRAMRIETMKQIL